MIKELKVRLETIKGKIWISELKERKKNSTLDSGKKKRLHPHKYDIEREYVMKPV